MTPESKILLVSIGGGGVRCVERCSHFGVGGGGPGRWRVPSGNCSALDHRHPTWIGSVTGARSESDK